MKLYFYFLETKSNKEPYVRTEECDAKESNKTFKLLDEVKGYYHRLVWKSEIGICSGCDREYQVILEEPNTGYAKKLFSDCLNKEIEEEQKYIEKLKEKLVAVENMEGIDHGTLK